MCVYCVCVANGQRVVNVGVSVSQCVYCVCVCERVSELTERTRVCLVNVGVSVS